MHFNLQENNCAYAVPSLPDQRTSRTALQFLRIFSNPFSLLCPCLAVLNARPRARVSVQMCVCVCVCVCLTLISCVHWPDEVLCHSCAPLYPQWAFLRLWMYSTYRVVCVWGGGG